MKVPKEIAEKAERYEKLKREVEKLYEELEEFAIENGFEDLYVYDFGVSQEPEGEEQENGEFCKQYMNGEDSGYGTCYFPIEGSTQYFCIGYSF